jgi:6-O-methylguanine DNA methyltransferase, DNA binding domain
MHLNADEIVAIPAERERFFGRAGRMLLPCPATVAALIREIPRAQVATIDLLRNELARRHEVDVVCPFHTKQSLLAIARESKEVACWRLVKKNGELLGYLPGGASNHAARLAEEGVAIKSSDPPRIEHLRAHLVRFESGKASGPTAS